MSKKFINQNHKVIEHYIGEHPSITSRYAIFCKDDNNLLDDCQGYGYKTFEAAKKAGWFKFSSGYKEYSKAKNFWDNNKELVNELRNISFYGFKDGLSDDEIYCEMLEYCESYCFDNDINEFEEAFLKKIKF
jgi:hypothetical protein